MHINTFDRYQHQESLVHHLDPRMKVVFTLLFIVSNVLLPDGAWLAFLAAWGLVWLAGRLAHFPAGYLFKRGFIVLPFVLAAVTVIFTRPGTPLFTLSIASTNLTATDAGLIRFSSIVVRSWLSLQMAILLTATTQFPDLMHALHHLRVPAILVAIISFMYRYLFVLADEAMRLLRARDARSARPEQGGGGGSIWWRAKVAGNMAGQLFVRSLERSDRVYNAMLARGYRGQLLTMNPHTLQGNDWRIAGIGLFLLLLIQLIGRL